MPRRATLALQAALKDYITEHAGDTVSTTGRRGLPAGAAESIESARGLLASIENRSQHPESPGQRAVREAGAGSSNPEAAARDLLNDQ